MKVNRLSLARAAFIVIFAVEARADFKRNIDWCIGNHTSDPGETNCPDQYAVTYPECITGGGRACLMQKAIASAKANDCANAFRLALICQCHNDSARSELASAGQQAICDYLRTK